MTWQERIKQLKASEHTYNQIADILTEEYGERFSGSKVRGWWRRNCGGSTITNVKGDTNADTPLETMGKQEYKNGSYTFENIVELIEGEEVTPDMMIKAHGLKVGVWEVVAYRNNFWQAQKKGGKKIVLYQSRLTVKPLKDGMDLSALEQYFKDKDFANDKPVIEPLQYDPSGEVLEICLPDLHSGLLAWRKETGADYDLSIVRERFGQCALDILARCEGRKFKKIVLVTLGDLLHIDNDEQKTTKGTFQQADGRLPKIFTVTLDMLIDFIDQLILIAPTEVIYTPGNHDRVSGFMLLKSLEKAYRRETNVAFDTTPNPQKFRLFGKCLVGWTHGDLAKKNMPHWLQHQAKAEYGQSNFAEVHAGHFHSIKRLETKLDITQEDEVGGIVVRYLPTLCNASYWEHQQAYTSASKTMMCFVWNEKTGLRDTWYCNVV